MTSTAVAFRGGSHGRGQGVGCLACSASGTGVTSYESLFSISRPKGDPSSDEGSPNAPGQRMVLRRRDAR